MPLILHHSTPLKKANKCPQLLKKKQKKEKKKVFLRPSPCQTPLKS